MSRGKKLLLLLGVLALLAAAAVAAGRLSHREEEEAAGEDSGETIFAVDADIVTSLAWTYGGESLSFSRADGGWTYDGDADFPLDESYLAAMLSALGGVRANKTIPDAGETSQYGLTGPSCAVTVTAGGEGTALLFGDETGLGGEVYCSVGDGNVYLVDASVPTVFSHRLLDIAEKEALPPSGLVTGFLVDAEGKTLTARLEEDGDSGGTWRCEEGSEALDTGKVNDFIPLLTGLTGGGCVSYRADAGALEEYGLSSASAGKIVLSWTDEDEAKRSVRLTLGAGADGGSYASLDGSGMVYAVDAATFGNVIHTACEDLLPDN